MQISLMIEGQNGLTWDSWKEVVRLAEDLGFAGLYRSDHFTNASPPDKDSLELWVSLSYLAATTERIRFSALVSPVSFRHPAMLARQAAALDDLSGGRAHLGMGAGWQEREHTLFGLELRTVKDRLDRLEEGLEVATRLLRSDDPVEYRGRFFQLEGATLLPRPRRPGGPPIVVGGNGEKRTLRLAARFSDVWNGIFLPPEEFTRLSEKVDGYAREEGRRPEDIRRTLMTGLYFAATSEEMDGRIEPFRANPSLKDRPTEEIVQLLKARGGIAGTGDEVREQLEAFEKAGVEEIMLQWLDLDDLDSLDTLAKSVLS